MMVDRNDRGGHGARVHKADRTQEIIELIEWLNRLTDLERGQI